MTAVVLARGLGRRMREGAAGAQLTADQAAAAAAGQKAMMPMGAGGRPFLDYALDSLQQAGCTRACLVIGPQQNDVRSHYATPGLAALDVVFAVQPEPLGTANALLAAQHQVGDAPFLVVNADNLYPVDALRRLVELDGPGIAAFSRADMIATSNIPAERITAFAVVLADEQGWLQQVIEKPQTDQMADLGPDPLVSMNAWRFDARLFDACRDVARSPRGEYELPAAVELAMTRGMRVRVLTARGPVLDLSRASDVAEVSRRLQTLSE